MKHNELIEIIKLFDTTQIDLVKIEDECTKLKLCKSSSKKAPTPSIEAKDVASEALWAQEEIEKAEADNTLLKSDLEQTKKKYYEVKSPMIGNFYRASSPEAKAFVEIGDYVKKGDPLCIIEAMKMLNEIKAEKSGTLVDILVENAAIVDFGKVLFLIEEEDV